MNKQDVELGQGVSVDWVDSSAEGGWLSKGNAEKYCEVGKITSLGYVVKNTEDGITLTTSKDRELRGFDPITIPWVAITSFETLTQGEG